MDKHCPKTTVKAQQNNTLFNMLDGLNMCQKEQNYEGIQILECLLRMSKEDFSDCKKAKKNKGVKRRAYDHFTVTINNPIASKCRWLGTFNTPGEVEAAYVYIASVMRERCLKVNSKL